MDNEKYRYVLITPTEDVVDKYNMFWSNEKDKITDWNVKLFEKPSIEVDIRKYIGDDPYESYGKKDKEIKDLWDKGKIEGFLKRINSVYSTRLGVSKLLGDKTINKEWLGGHNVDDLVEECSKKLGKKAYSFSTKVYSFINPKENPIVDSYVGSLLRYYMSPACDKENWGNYGNYKKAYDKFKEDYKLTKRTYKEIDVFLWTYAVALQNYWEESGVIKFRPIEYKEKQ